MSEEIGKIVVKTEIDTKGIDKGISAVEKKLEKMYQKQIQGFEYNKLTGVGTTKIRKFTEEEQNYIDRLENTLDKLYKKRDALLETENIQQKITEKSSDESSNINRWVDGVYTTASGKRLIKKEDEEITEEERKQNILTRQHIANLDKVGTSLKKIIKNVIRWGLAVFGIRGAYMAIRNAINVISQDDEQLKADINYIKTAMAYALEPVVRKVVELAKQLLFFIGSVVKFLTGKNIFDNANKSLKSANKEASKLSKTLASFDEMNILNDTSSGTSGEATTPSFDLTNIPDFTETIEKFKTKWFEFGDELEKYLYNMPFDIWTQAFGSWDLAIYGVIQTIHGLWGMITSIAQMFTGLWEVIHGLITGDTKEIEKGFKDFFDGLSKGIKYSYETIVGISNIIKGVIKGIIQTVWGWLFDYINKGIAKFNEFSDKIVSSWGRIRDKIKNTIQDIQNWLTEKFGVIGTKIGEIVGGAFKNVVNAVLSAIESLLNVPIRSINNLIDTINKVPGINITRMQTFRFPRLAKGGIINQPGRGVPLGYGGERGAEGVIPLTDSQQMALLGEAIGKYITMNATVPVYIGNRLVLREMKRIEAEDNFAFNR